jgi:glycosyltransferase involved in cell wall biosynthesis
VKPGKTGWLVPPNDPEALARVMTQLAAHPDQLAQAGHAAFTFAQNNFDPKTNAARIAEIMSR